jgi:Tfp pilus assembly protein PilV
MRQGSVMIEAMIGLSLLLTGMLGILNLLTNSMRASDTIASQFVAANLAAEGIEVVKNIMDDLLVQSSDWTYVVNGIPDGAYELDSLTQNFGIDVNDSTRARSIFTPLSLAPLTLDFTTREYGYSSDPNAVETTFKRTVETTWNNDPLTGEPISLSVSSHVDWTVRGKDFSVVIDDQFYRWRL